MKPTGEYRSVFSAIRGVVPLHSPAILEFAILNSPTWKYIGEYKRGSTRLQNSGMKIRFMDMSETSLRFCITGRAGIVGITCASPDGNKRYMFNLASDGSLKETPQE